MDEAHQAVHVGGRQVGRVARVGRQRGEGAGVHVDVQVGLEIGAHLDQRLRLDLRLGVRPAVVDGARVRRVALDRVPVLVEVAVDVDATRVGAAEHAVLVVLAVDLLLRQVARAAGRVHQREELEVGLGEQVLGPRVVLAERLHQREADLGGEVLAEIGRASCRERV